MSARSTSENCGRLGELAGHLERFDALADLAALHQRPALTGQGANLELDRPGRPDVLSCVTERLDGVVVAVRLGQRLGACQHRLDPRANVGGHALREIRGVDTEPLRDPGDRLGGRARLAALDLADVLLREALAGELGLGHSRGDAKRTQPLSDPGGGRTRRAGGDGGVSAHDGSPSEPADGRDCTPSKG